MASMNEDKNHHPASAGSRPLHEPALSMGGGELEEIKPDQVGLPSRNVPSTAGNPDNRKEIKPDQVGLPSRNVPSTAGNPDNHLNNDCLLYTSPSPRDA